MLTNNDIKYIRSLNKKKYRQKYNNFIIEGKKMLLEAIEFANNKIEKIYCLQNFYQSHENTLKPYENIITLISSNELKKISNLSTPNSGIAIISQDKIVPDQFELGDFVVFLDDIQDPGNMGTIIRTCDWFGVNNLLVSENCVDIYNPKVLQSSMGSIFRLPVLKSSFEEMLKITAGYKLIGAILDGDNLYERKYSPPFVVIIGNESKGISDHIINQLDYKITIPRYGTDTESLNASVATGIIIGELARNMS